MNIHLELKRKLELYRFRSSHNRQYLSRINKICSLNMYIDHTSFQSNQQIYYFSHLCRELKWPFNSWLFVVENKLKNLFESEFIYIFKECDCDAYYDIRIADSIRYKLFSYDNTSALPKFFIVHFPNILK